ncbi:MFS transporter [Tuwongella immobilis]|uniref:Major facilitator superfamily (MFS) profile domain-containing protein n=1 Tax=Tuwongella immobilis TaxID=692036 RepID=A0A6C2YUA4_9BACT|nr:MFS transporter [Tuwongella immobilis]VIP05014.1 major facilitator superfamily protein : Uncharacterized protein OS=Parachlamydia acanthamoebae (strain UV7) GN=PUV_06880 PE=4 SV=1: MFS_1 [Tuwongella immobilis]VTS07386.1 major facilitator superfamily protein : Uncharacterized protein OS=Parachlamydia acanthamoebae (strain UV7) GN=PUV_06880 PE=4 SV=1: MFS_1 [Tuwongella immobilis]
MPDAEDHPPTANALPIPPDGIDPLTRHNMIAETLFSAFNGIFMGLAILAAPVMAVVGYQANPLELTILVAAFPVGVFFGPLWAGFGRRVGMQRLVTQMAIWANLPLFAIFWVEQAWLFTLLVSISQILNSGMRMGQSSLYPLLYPKAIRGRVLGRLTFWTFLTMVPTILMSGWLLDCSREMVRVLYPLAGMCGLIGAVYYHTIVVPGEDVLVQRDRSWMAGLNGVRRVLQDDQAHLLYQGAFFLSGSAFFLSSHIVLLLVCDRFDFSAFELALWMTVMPQLLLAVSSPIWGRIYDRVGLVNCRLLISAVMTTYLMSYWLGIVLGWPVLIVLGSILMGLSNGGGQVTWALTPSHFAKQPADVPIYNGIHFVLNGTRGLVMPWIGSVMWVLTGPAAVLVAVASSVASAPLLLRVRQMERAQAPSTELVPTSPAGWTEPPEMRGAPRSGPREARPQPTNKPVQAC